MTTRPDGNRWHDRRYWRGYQRQVAREFLLKRIAQMLVYYVCDDTPANRVQRKELEAIATMIRKRQKAKPAKKKTKKAQAKEKP